MKITLEEFAKKYKGIEAEDNELKEFLGVKKSKVWKPKIGERYWIINWEGDAPFAEWENILGDKAAYAMGNCFKTKEEAKFMIEKLKVIAELKRFAEENNEGKIDWYDLNKRKWCLLYSFHRYEITICLTYESKHNGIFFTSEEIAKEAIKTIGEERLMKYYFEVDE